MQQLVIIQNDGSEDFTAKYDGEQYTIPAGESSTFPWDVMIVWMGDPGIINERNGRQRDEVYDRLCSYYNARGLLGNDPEKLPAITAWTLEGEQIVTILDDPKGDLYAPRIEGNGDTALLQRQIDSLQRQLDEKINGLADTPDRVDEDSELVGGRTAGTEGQRRAEIDAQRAEDLGLTGDEADGDAGTTAPTDEGSATNPADDLDIPTDAPTQTPVGRSKSGTAPATAARKAPAKRGATGSRRRTSK